MKALTFISFGCMVILFGCNSKSIKIAETNSLKIELINNSDGLWRYTVPATGKTFTFNFPQFEIDGKLYEGRLDSVDVLKGTDQLKNGSHEFLVEGNLADLQDVKLQIIYQVADDNPIVKFKYLLRSINRHRLTKSGGHDRITYFTASLDGFDKNKEVRFSEFNEMVHSFCLSERELDAKHFNDSISVMGPLISSSDGKNSFLIAYEHGSQVPDRFLEYSLHPDKSVALNAVKGNYYNGFELGTESFESVWFETGAVAGNEETLAEKYRSFVLHHMSQNRESRKPYIFYNTWNFQERNRNWYKKPYLADMTSERMLKEIEVAHQMGIEVFVVDAGWFEKTGDWMPSKQRFPDGLKSVSEKLKSYGMKLGLWFNPTVAAVSSNMLKKNTGNIQTWNGESQEPFPIWETEESYSMCLVSPYRDDFADKLIELYNELGVTYFKWDAIGQYGCNNPNHFHGGPENTPEERADSYAFQIGNSMSYVVDKLVKECPDAIVDFDITEGGRTVGLGFLSSGKYFLINNGPYYFNYDIPFDRENGQWNIFFYPGPARTWICRTPLTFDKWIPSVLFLTHYLPDDPYSNQSIAVASLILGQNGIWGDLPDISTEGIKFFNKTLGMYKQVRNDITETAMIRDGAVGGSPEVYEKVNPETGKGAIVIFSSHGGNYTYISRNKVDSAFWNSQGAEVTIDSSGLAKINATFKNAEAKIIFFGIKE